MKKIIAIMGLSLIALSIICLYFFAMFKEIYDKWGLNYFLIACLSFLGMCLGVFLILKFIKWALIVLWN